ncbi:MAG: nucleotide exchange factor GrpE [Desulfobacterales bacterium]|nr:nucleotide exchange factor GrpE [Desulfobacterales bacterium]
MPTEYDVNNSNDFDNTQDNSGDEIEIIEGQVDESSNPVKELEEKLRKAETEAKDNYDRLLRVSAEFENYKKRSLREFTDFRKYAYETLVKELLPIIDNLERALISSQKDGTDINVLIAGVNLTLKELFKVFERFNITQFDSVGKPFDPNFHEAVSRIPTNEYPENTVVQELHKGYMINEKLLRPSMVVVSAPLS